MLLLLFYMYRIHIQRSAEGVYHSENGNHRAINNSGLLYTDMHNSMASILKLYTGKYSPSIKNFYFSDLLWKKQLLQALSRVFSLEKTQPK